MCEPSVHVCKAEFHTWFYRRDDYESDDDESEVTININHAGNNDNQWISIASTKDENESLTLYSRHNPEDGDLYSEPTVTEEVLIKKNLLALENGDNVQSSKVLTIQQPA